MADPALADGPMDETVGGLLQVPALCLLDGFEDETGTRYRIPIRKLPATLGRMHENTSAATNFVSLGSAKAISRYHVRVDYGAKGGYLESTDDGGFEFREDPEYDDLPESGSFVIKLLSKNRILVDRKHITQGEMVLLNSSHTIRIGPLNLYFFLPQTETSSHDGNGSSTTMPTKKRWSIDVSSAKPTAVKSSVQSQQTHLYDKHTWEELEKAQESAETERRQQIIAAAMAVQAVRAAAAALGQAEVMRNELSDWIAQTHPYSEFQQKMMERMENKSYQACITKALTRSGFVRNSGTGRFIKWQVPDSILEGGDNIQAHDSDEDDEEEEDDDEQGSVDDNKGSELQDDMMDEDTNGNKMIF